MRTLCLPPIFQPKRSPLIDVLKRARENQSSGWSELWESNESDLWDRGKPSPALIDFIESHPTALPKAENGRRLRALVPVCFFVFAFILLPVRNTIFTLV